MEMAWYLSSVIPVVIITSCHVPVESFTVLPQYRKTVQSWCADGSARTPQYASTRKGAGNSLDAHSPDRENSARGLVGRDKQLASRRGLNSKRELKDSSSRRYGRTSLENEMIQRLIDNKTDNQSFPKINDLMPKREGDWYVLEPIVSNLPNVTAHEVICSDWELPVLSTLLFVNKSPGMSTLPTRSQLVKRSLGNGSVTENHDGDFGSDSDTYQKIIPCLSDTVINWLCHHPDGILCMKHAKDDENRWWNLISQSMSNNADSNTRKLWKKKKHQREKLVKMSSSSFEPRPVHRLDIDTSGIVCIALTPYALRTACMLFERKSRESGEYTGESQASIQGVEKRYVALVEGDILSEVNTENFSEQQGMISYSVGKVWVEDKVKNDNPEIGYDVNNGHHKWACDIRGDGHTAFCRPGDSAGHDSLKFVEGSLRDALTFFSVVDVVVNRTVDVADQTRVELTPHTGRGHQLRLHMAAIGHPIVGDDMHGVIRDQNESPQLKGDRLCLHASNLSISCWELDEKDDVRICRACVSSTPRF